MDGRKILFIVDNCPTPPKSLKDCKMLNYFFLPPDTTSKIYPCDVGFISALKIHYLYQLYCSLLEVMK